MRALAVRGARARCGAVSGFTLLEIMVALVITGILVSLAHSAFRGVVMRARRSEAVLGLTGIFQAQQAYFQAENAYGDDFDEIGFALDGGQRLDARTIQGTTYTFTMRAFPLGGDPRGNFQALASGDLDPGDGVLDILMIENGLTVPH